jgi:hypothetical protein
MLIMGLPAVTLPDKTDGDCVLPGIVGDMVIEVLSLVLGPASEVPFCPVLDATLGPRVTLSVGPGPGVVIFDTRTIGAPEAEPLSTSATVGVPALVPLEPPMKVGVEAFPAVGIAGVVGDPWLDVMGPIVLLILIPPGMLGASGRETLEPELGVAVPALVPLEPPIKVGVDVVPAEGVVAVVRDVWLGDMGPRVVIIVFPPVMLGVPGREALEPMLGVAVPALVLLEPPIIVGIEAFPAEGVLVVAGDVWLDAMGPRVVILLFPPGMLGVPAGMLGVPAGMLGVPGREALEPGLGVAAPALVPLEPSVIVGIEAFPAKGIVVVAGDVWLDAMGLRVMLVVFPPGMLGAPGRGALDPGLGVAVFGCNVWFTAGVGRPLWLPPPPAEVRLRVGEGVSDDTLTAEGVEVTVPLDGSTVVSFWTVGTDDIFENAGDGLTVPFKEMGVGSSEDKFPGTGGWLVMFVVWLEGDKDVAFWIVGANDIFADWDGPEVAFRVEGGKDVPFWIAGTDDMFADIWDGREVTFTVEGWKVVLLTVGSPDTFPKTLVGPAVWLPVVWLPAVGTGVERFPDKLEGEIVPDIFVDRGVGETLLLSMAIEDGWIVIRFPVSFAKDGAAVAVVFRGAELGERVLLTVEGALMLAVVGVTVWLSVVVVMFTGGAVWFDAAAMGASVNSPDELTEVGAIVPFKADGAAVSFTPNVGITVGLNVAFTSEGGSTSDSSSTTAPIPMILINTPSWKSCWIFRLSASAYSCAVGALGAMPPICRLLDPSRLRWQPDGPSPWGWLSSWNSVAVSSQSLPMQEASTWKLSAKVESCASVGLKKARVARSAILSNGSQNLSFWRAL